MSRFIETKKGAYIDATKVYCVYYAESTKTIMASIENDDLIMLENVEKEKKKSAIHSVLSNMGVTYEQ